VSEARKKAALEDEAKRTALREVVAKYDTNSSGKLEKDQICQLLTDIDDFSPAGTPPTDTEVDFILSVADQEGNGCLDADEIEGAIRTWRIYTQHRARMEEAIAKHDKSNTGKLNQAELKEYLRELNDGEAVSDAEAKWVLEEADLLGDGSISKPELVMATSAWYGRVESKMSEAKMSADAGEAERSLSGSPKSQCCTIS